MVDERARVSGLVDHLFRRAAGQMVSVLTRTLGPAHLDLAEEVVQDALLRALQVWPASGVPDDPRAWLFSVARNRAIDRLRREHRFADQVERLALEGPTTAGGHVSSEGVGDDELRMVLMCCHPVLPRDARVALTLKTVGGFSIREIGRAFLTRDTTIAQRVVRAKRLLRDRGIGFDLSPRPSMTERVTSGLEVLYLMFNEGYAAHEGDALIRWDLCREAIRLTELLANHPDTSSQPGRALLALMYFQAARLPGRQDDEGGIVLLADQDRGRWDRKMIAAGFAYLDRAGEGPHLSAYHLEAAIAGAHATATDYAGTDWSAVLSLYDRLVELNPSPVIALNRAVAVSMVEGPAAAIAALDSIRTHPAMRDYYLLPATLADFHRRLNQPELAAGYLRDALAMRCSEPEKRFLRRRLADGVGRT